MQPMNAFRRKLASWVFHPAAGRTLHRQVLFFVRRHASALVVIVLLFILHVTDVLFPFLSLLWDYIQLFLKTVWGINDIKIPDNTDITVRAEVTRQRIWSVSSAAGIVIAFIGVAVALSRSIPAWRQASVESRKHETEIFSDSFKLIGADQPFPTIMGAVQLLENLARDSKRLHEPIMETFSAYIRNPPIPKGIPNGPDIRSSIDPFREMLPDQRPCDHPPTVDVGAKRCRSDVQAMLRAVARRKRTNESRSFRIDLTGAQLQGADLANAHLEGVIFRGCNLEGANLEHAFLEGADLSEANMCNAKLVSAHLKGAFLVKTNLTEAVLDKADIRYAKLCNAKLSKARLVGSNLSHANFYRTDLEKANAVRAILFSADLRFSNLSAADFSNANLGRCDLHGARIDRAVFLDAILDGVIGKTYVSLRYRKSAI